MALQGHLRFRRLRKSACARNARFASVPTPDWTTLRPCMSWYRKPFGMPEPSMIWLVDLRTHQFDLSSLEFGSIVRPKGPAWAASAGNPGKNGVSSGKLAAAKLDRFIGNQTVGEKPGDTPKRVPPSQNSCLYHIGSSGLSFWRNTLE